MDRASEIDREAGAAELQREVLRHFRRVECLQHNLAAQIVNGQVLPEARQCRRGGFGRVAVGGHHEHPRRPLTASERRHDVEGGEIRPMQILEHEDQRPIGSDGFECFTDFANHPLARGAGGLAL